jgi:hypothetical protein
MALDIETFSNTTGGTAFFKAVGHPAAAAPAAALIARLAQAGPVALYDPNGIAGSFAEIHPLDGVEIAGVYVQKIEDVGKPVFGHAAQPVTELPASGAALVFVVAFDADKPASHIAHLMPDGAEPVTLDAMRLPEALLTRPDRYLDPLNFATNFAFFRDADGHHTRLTTANYWARYGAGPITLHAWLFDTAGAVIAQWDEPAPPDAGSITIDSRSVRDRFGLPAFTGQLFLHAVGARGHDVVKYALDTYGDGDDVLSCTHDANAWPADRYAGLPAPRDGEKVVLWVQNSHPCPIPANGVGLNKMGDEEVVWLDRAIPAFGSYPLDVADLMPAMRWPEQIEVQAGKYFVRPRYEITAPSGRSRIAHVNVERTDLAPDPRIAELSNLVGKGYVLPAPVLPLDRMRSALLPTPMSTAQTTLPLALKIYDAGGREMHTARLGCLERSGSEWVPLDEPLAANGGLPSGYGHVELLYDFADGGEADGWLHAIFRYEDKASGHAAETSFGAHIFNTVLTYRNEPQSYTGAPPGLSTRLFLRLGAAPLDTQCHLIYTSATTWHPHSATDLILHDGAGAEVARERVAIPCNGSLLWRYGEMFDAAARRKAGDGAYVIVRDTTCRLFGYHGLVNGAGAFSFDHMFGF